MIAKRSSADRRVFMGGSEESPVSSAKTYGSSSSKHSSRLSKPDSEPRTAKCGVQIWAGTKSTSGQTSRLMAIEPQDGPPVRLEIADGPQTTIEHFGMRQIGEHDEIVHFARTAMLLVDRADLHREQKAHLVSTGRRQLLLDSLPPWVFESVQTLLGRLQLLLQLGEPGRVREITCTHDSNALECRPFVEIFEIQRTARGPGIA